MPFVHHDPIRFQQQFQQPGLQPTVICLDAVIGVPIAAVLLAAVPPKAG